MKTVLTMSVTITVLLVVVTDWQVKPPVLEVKEQVDGRQFVASVQFQPLSTVHYEEHPSPLFLLPSSQSSPKLGSPLPHKLVGVPLGFTTVDVAPT